MEIILKNSFTKQFQCGLVPLPINFQFILKLRFAAQGYHCPFLTSYHDLKIGRKKVFSFFSFEGIHLLFTKLI